MSNFFSKENIKNEIRNANIIAIESLPEKDKSKLILFLEKYVNDVIDFLNNSNIEDLIFEEDKEYLDMKYIEKKNDNLVFLLLNKRKSIICKLFIFELYTVYKELYESAPDASYIGNFKIEYALASEFNLLDEQKTIYENRKRDEYIRLEERFKEFFYAAKFFNFEIMANSAQCLFDKKIKSEKIKITIVINHKFLRITPENDNLKSFDLFYSLLQGRMQGICDVENVKDFNFLVKKVSSLNFKIKELINNEDFKGVSFNREKSSPFKTPAIHIKYEYLNLKIFAGSYDIEKILNEDIHCSGCDNKYKSTMFKFRDYINNKDEVLEYLKLQNY